MLITIQPKLAYFTRLLGESEPNHTRNDFRSIAYIIEKLQNIPELPPKLLTLPMFNKTLDEYRIVVFHGQKREQIKAKIEARFRTDVLAINASQLLATWNRVSGQWFLPRYFEQRKINKVLNQHVAERVDPGTVKKTLYQIVQYQEEADFVSKLCHLAEELVSIEKKLTEVLGITTETLHDDSMDWNHTALTKVKNWTGNLDKLKDWHQWLLVGRKLDEFHLGFIANEYKEKNIHTGQVFDISHKSFYQVAIQSIISKEKNLELFNGKIFNDIIAKYKQD